jgi:hypothetical protein
VKVEGNKDENEADKINHPEPKQKEPHLHRALLQESHELVVS